MSSQNYKTHRQYVPLHHFVLYPLIFVCFIASIWLIYTAFFIVHHGRLIALTFAGLSAALIILAFCARLFALKAQDRAIRAEENLRYFALTGKLLDSRLTLSQVIALRFASDPEFLLLAERATNDNLKANQIKKAIVNWRPDHHRV
jgi:hypothetical protein